MKKGVIVYSFVLISAFGYDIKLKDIVVGADLGNSGGLIKQSDIGSSIYNKEYINNAQKGDGTISEIVKKLQYKN